MCSRGGWEGKEDVLLEGLSRGVSGGHVKRAPAPSGFLAALMEEGGPFEWSIGVSMKLRKQAFQVFGFEAIGFTAELTPHVRTALLLDEGFDPFPAQ